jgi:hypothetical protein
MALMVIRRGGRTSSVVLLERDAGLRLRRVRLRDRVRARLRAGTLDRELAEGACPEASVDLALHAAHLCEATQRRVLAGTLSRIASATDSPAASAAPISTWAVQRARPELSAVLDRLGSSGPLGVGGVARLRCLLTDGGGPLYRPSAPGQLSRELAAALAALEPSA